MVNVTLYISEEDLDRVTKTAELDGRSRNNFIIKAIKECCDKIEGDNNES